MSITLVEICDALKTTLAAATGITYAYSFDELKEGIPDFPAIQVYFETFNQDIAYPSADRTTFRAGVRQSEVVFYVDLFACQRSEIGEDMAALLPLIDALIDVFEAQDSKPYFGLVGIKAFHYSIQRVVFEYGQFQYMGARFTVTVRVF